MYFLLLPVLLLLHLAPLTLAAFFAGDIHSTCVPPGHRYAIPTADVHAAANDFLSACKKRNGPTFPDLGVFSKMSRENSGCYNYAISGRAVLSVCLEDGMSVKGAEIFNRWSCDHAAIAWKELGNTDRCPQGKVVFHSWWGVGPAGRFILESFDVAEGHGREKRPPPRSQG